MKKISRNSKQLEAIMTNAAEMVCHSEDTYFRAKPIEQSKVASLIARYFGPTSIYKKTTLTQDGDTFTLHVHGNLWFVFTA